MPRTAPRTTMLLTIVSLAGAPAFAQSEKDKVPLSDETPFLYHDRHMHPHNPKHVTVAPDGSRFFTTRPSEVVLPLPGETEAFTFVVYGDRTGGPNEGVNILADAVRDTNLFEPDMVMTVGDLVQGYSDTETWMTEMREYKAIMSNLICPWFPVAGNHDTYWRGSEPRDHDDQYEIHFGPLWYSFSHKNSNFIVLYTDEGNPDDGGRKSFREPAAQRISSEQLAFLEQALERGAEMDHQFIFLHHPRWLSGGYGNDWNDKVHPLLTSAGNVTAVFAGHIHQMRTDPKDGIEYVTLATVGGGQGGHVPDAGWLHQYNVITVRPDQVAMASVPVGEVMDVRDITGEVHDECTVLARTEPEILGTVDVSGDGSANARVAVVLDNPTSRKVEFVLTPETDDGRWNAAPDHLHGTLMPGASQTFAFSVSRPGVGFDDAFDELRFAIDRDYLTESQRYSIPTTTAGANLTVDLDALPPATEDRALVLDGKDDAVRVDSAVASIPDGPFTLECWFKPEAFASRVGLIAKTQGSEYSIFASRGVPSFSVHLGGQYRTVRAGEALETGVWHHIAGVYDGSRVVLYINGQQAADESVDPGWTRRTNSLPLYIGADPGGGGEPMSFAQGTIDNVHLSGRALYAGAFEPGRSITPDADTVFFYDMDRAVGPFVPDEGPMDHTGRLLGKARFAPAAETESRSGGVGH